jgi:hypothetical protein
MSIIATTLKHLIAAGMSGDDLVRAVEEIEAEVQAARPVDEAAERRRQRDREYQAEKRAARRQNRQISADSSDTADAAPFPAPAPSFPPDPQTNPTPTHTPGETSRARGATRLPDDWRPKKLDRETVSGGIVENRGQEWAKRALESFKNHWRSANGPNSRKRDWQAAFANWVIEQDNRDGRSNGMGRNQSGTEARIVGAGRSFIARGAGSPPG